jgi:hypothetical protein
MSLKDDLLRHLNEDCTLDDMLHDLEAYIFDALVNPSEKSVADIVIRYARVRKRVAYMESIGLELSEKLRSSY